MGFLNDFIDGFINELENTFHTVGEALGDALEPVAEILGFTDTTVYVYAMGCSRIIPDSEIPKMPQLTQELLRRTQTGSDISDIVKALAVSGAKSTILKYAEYGKNSYSFGLPTTKIKGYPDNLIAFQTIVENLLTSLGYAPAPGTGLVTPTIRFPDTYDIGLSYLQENHGYKTSMVIDTETCVYQGLEIDAETKTFRARLGYHVSPTETDVKYVDLPDISDFYTEKYYHYSNTVVDDQNKKFRFVHVFPYDYAGDNGEYPQLVESTIGNPDAGEDPTKLLPIAILKRRNQYTTSSQGYYNSTKELLKIINLDLDDLVSALQDNSDMSAVTDAFILFGANPFSNFQDIRTYLFLYFRLVYKIMALNSYGNYVDTPIEKRKPLFIKIEEQSYNTVIAFNYIRLDYKSGSVGEPGTVTRTVNDLPDETYEVEYRTLVEMGRDSYYETRTETKTHYVSNIVFRRQINETVYEELTVHGLQLITQILADDGTPSIKNTRLNDSENFIIPVGYGLLNLFSLDTGEKLLYKTLHLVMFASDSQDLEWYQTAEFMNFAAAIITIIMVIATFGSSSAFSEVLLKLFVQVVLRELLLETLEVNDFTADEATALIVVYAAVSVYAGGGAEVFSSLIDSILAIIPAIGEGAKIYAGVEQENLREQAEAEKEEYEEYQEYLQKIQDGLNSDSDINPLYLMTSYRPRYELPGDFHSRTLTTNTAEICLNFPDTFVSSKLDVENTII